MTPTLRSLWLGCMSFLLLLGNAGAKKPPVKRIAAPSAAAAPAAAPAAPAASAPSDAPAPAADPKSTAEVAAPPAAPAVVGSAVASPAEPATASSPPPAPNLTPEQLALARQHFEAGLQSFQDKQYDAALNEFTTAFEISKEPDLLYNLHRVAIRLGQKDMAVAYLRQYLKYRPAEADKLQAEIDRINAEAPPPSAPPVLAPAAVTPSDAQPTKARWPGAVLMVFGGASAVTGIALLAASAALPTDAAADKTRNSALLGTGGFLLGTGAVEVIGGLALYLVRRPKTQVALAPAGAGLQLAGAF